LSDRWAIAIGGSAVMLLIGTVYSWSIFAQPLVVAFGRDLTTTTCRGQTDEQKRQLAAFLNPL